MAVPGAMFVLKIARLADEGPTEKLCPLLLSLTDTKSHPVVVF
jgi:hypothetical protein